MAVVNFTLPTTLENEINKVIKKSGFASKAEFFRFSARYVIEKIDRETALQTNQPINTQNAVAFSNKALNEMDKIDQQIWKDIEPTYRRVRKNVFKKKHPKLYKKYYDKQS